MAKRSPVHVEPREKGWAVVREGKERATSVHSTQAEAAKAGRAIARRNETEFFLHTQDGEVAQGVQDTAGRAAGQAQEAVGGAAQQAQEAAGEATQQAQGAVGGDGQEEPNATEAARKRAEELGVDLSQVEGSGAGGRITIKDVQGEANQG